MRAPATPITTISPNDSGIACSRCVSKITIPSALLSSFHLFFMLRLLRLPHRALSTRVLHSATINVGQFDTLLVRSNAAHVHVRIYYG